MKVKRIASVGIPVPDIDSPVCRMAVLPDPDGDKMIIHKLKPEGASS